MSYEKVEHLGDEDPALIGWWIVYYDDDHTCYDAVGPYISEEEALRIQKEHPIE